ncbi:hypothetical protein CDL15_Pgr016384 [Punica granatum]|uniref:Uncharacterized protein n=1 Tax=Punica granatum TaxID=22663 RepID=A0A218W5N0_PUNGR|nr:hypothetical protein CDL15_Pgr016384 [Punica granatum]
MGYWENGPKGWTGPKGWIGPTGATLAGCRWNSGWVESGRCWAGLTAGLGLLQLGRAGLVSSWAGPPRSGLGHWIWTGPLDLGWSAGSGSGCYLRCPGEELTRLAEKERKQRGEEGWSGRFDGGGSRDGELGWSGSYGERLDLRTKSVWDPTVGGEAAGQKKFELRIVRPRAGGRSSVS